MVFTRHSITPLPPSNHHGLPTGLCALLPRSGEDLVVPSCSAAALPATVLPPSIHCHRHTIYFLSVLPIGEFSCTLSSHFHSRFNLLSVSIKNWTYCRLKERIMGQTSQLLSVYHMACSKNNSKEYELCPLLAFSSSKTQNWRCWRCSP